MIRFRLHSENKTSGFLRRLFTSVVLVSFLAQQAPAEDFASALGEGRSLGSQAGRIYGPDVLDSTLQSKGMGTTQDILPRGNDQSSGEGHYTGYYTQPGNMGNAAQGEALDFVRGSYEGRPRYDLAEDATFGSRCLETDAEGRCWAWSLSKDLVTSAYPDCTKVLIPHHQTSYLATCTGTSSALLTPECRQRNYLSTSVEAVQGPCAALQMDAQADQIYAVCRDNVELYRVNKGTVQNPFGVDYADVRAEMCEVIGGCGYCWDSACPAAYTVSETEIPEGSSYLGQGIGNVWVTGGPGDRIGHGTWYRYYSVMHPSIVERVFLRSDGTCSTADIERWRNDCTMKDFLNCDSSYSDCTYLIQDGQETGNVVGLECQEHASVIGGYQSPYCGQACLPNCWEICSPEYDACVVSTACSPEYDGCVAGCEGNQNCLNDCNDLYCISCGNSQECTGSCRAQYCSQQCDYTTVTCSSQCDGITMNGYRACSLPGAPSGVSLNAALLPATPQSYGFTTAGDYGQTLTWQTLFGGPGAEKNINKWYTKVTFSCGVEQNDCAALEEQGCVPYARRCTGDACTHYEYTYRCGKDGVTGYGVAYNCAGRLRCMGTDCADASYQANTDLSAVATMGEVLNMARVDSTKSGSTIVIFPGQEMECQAGPKNCCKPTSGGLSIGDYVEAGQAVYSLYSYASQGVSGVATGYATNITSLTNTLASRLGFAEAVATYSEAGGIATTSATITTDVGTTTINTTFAGADMASSAVLSTPGATISMIGTAVSAVGLVLTAYSVLSMAFDMAFACSQEDMETSIKLGYNLCHYVDMRSEKKWWFISQRWKRYCCFNSILARIVHEQGRRQIGLGWGGGNSPLDCRGLTTEEIASLDFSQIDLTEYIQYVTNKTAMSEADIQRITDNLRQKIESTTTP